MAKNLTASDRKSLIRLASALPAGSPERRAILAGLHREANTLELRVDLPSYHPQDWDKYLERPLKALLRDPAYKVSVLGGVGDTPYLSLQPKGSEQEYLEAVRRDLGHLARKIVDIYTEYGVRISAQDVVRRIGRRSRELVRALQVTSGARMASGKQARVKSKRESMRLMNGLEKQHGSRTKEAVLKGVKDGVIAPAAVVGGGYKDGKKVAIKWLEGEIKSAPAKTAKTRRVLGAAGAREFLDLAHSIFPKARTPQAAMKELMETLEYLGEDPWLSEEEYVAEGRDYVDLDGATYEVPDQVEVRWDYKERKVKYYLGSDADVQAFALACTNRKFVAWMESLVEKRMAEVLKTPEDLDEDALNDEFKDYHDRYEGEDSYDFLHGFYKFGPLKKFNIKVRISAREFSYRGEALYDLEYDLSKVEWVEPEPRFEEPDPSYSRYGPW